MGKSKRQLATLLDEDLWIRIDAARRALGQSLPIWLGRDPRLQDAEPQKTVELPGSFSAGKTAAFNKALDQARDSGQEVWIAKHPQYKTQLAELPDPVADPYEWPDVIGTASSAPSEPEPPKITYQEAMAQARKKHEAAKAFEASQNVEQ